jgi:putative membrane protein
MKKLETTVAVMVAAAAALAGCATHVDLAPAATMGAAAALAPADMHFAMAAAGSGMFEVEVSRMAAAKATVPAVRNFAQMLVHQHTMANNELIAVLHRKGVTPPAALPAHLRSQLRQLSGMSGASFDNAYIRMVGLQDHQQDIATFERAIPRLGDRDLRGWAEKNLPVLQMHLREAQDVAGLLAG